MSEGPDRLNRRDWLGRAASVCLGGAFGYGLYAKASAGDSAKTQKARIAITLDLEMSRNFPRWEDTHWDYAKGNLDEPSKRYSVEAARRVKQRGGRIHFFCVGQVLEQQDVTWLKTIADDGHPIGNHTYDHIITPKGN